MNPWHPLTEQDPPTRPEKKTPLTPRLEALISFFKSLENRTCPEPGSTPPHLVEQSEEDYQKEQAEWLARIKKGRR